MDIGSMMRAHIKKHDLVVEVLFEATEHRDLGVKADRYLACGVREYWIAHPDQRYLQLWINSAEKWEKKSGTELASEVLAGLTIRAVDIWPAS